MAAVAVWVVADPWTETGNTSVGAILCIRGHKSPDVMLCWRRVGTFRRRTDASCQDIAMLSRAERGRGVKQQVRKSWRNNSSVCSKGAEPYAVISWCRGDRCASQFCMDGTLFAELWWAPGPPQQAPLQFFRSGGTRALFVRVSEEGTAGGMIGAVEPRPVVGSTDRCRRRVSARSEGRSGICPPSAGTSGSHVHP